MIGSYRLCIYDPWTLVGLHAGKKPFKCSFCLTAFSQLGGLKKHTASNYKWASDVYDYLFSVNGLLQNIKSCKTRATFIVLRWRYVNNLGLYVLKAVIVFIILLIYLLISMRYFIF